MDELWELEVNAIDQSQEDILVVVDQFVVKVLEKDDVPVHNNLLRRSMVLCQL